MVALYSGGAWAGAAAAAAIATFAFATTSTSGQNTAMETATDSIISFPAVEEDFVYWLRVRMTVSFPANSLRFYGATVHYTYTNVTP